MTLPRLKVPYRYAMYDAEKQHYVPRILEVEVLSLHLNSGKMVVRTLEPIAVFEGSTPRKQVFTTLIDPFFEHYKIEAAYDYI